MSELRNVSPVLLVGDVVKAAAYYADALGFEVPRMWGEPPHFCIPQRGQCTVMLNQVEPGDAFRPNADFQGRYDVYFDVDDADALFAELRTRGADIVCEPESMPYGMREFSVRDPDGHVLAFGQEVPEAPRGSA